MHCNSIKSAPQKVHAYTQEWYYVLAFATALGSSADMSLFGNAGRNAYFGQHLIKMSFEDDFELKIDPMNGSTAYKTLWNTMQTKIVQFRTCDESSSILRALIASRS